MSQFSSLILLAGISGAGKSTALDALSDMGFFSVDNLPVPLLTEFINHTKSAPAKYYRTVLLLDIDSRERLAQLLQIIQKLRQDIANIQLIFIDSSNEAIIKRYSETRRPHPGFDAVKDKTLGDAIQRERNRFLPFKEISNLVIDTSRFTVHDLKREVRAFVDSLTGEQKKLVRVNFLSFGFKYGVPLDCDLLVDVRFLPNPHFIDALRDKDGLEPEVKKYVLDRPEAGQFVSRYGELLAFLLPKYIYEGKSYVNVGVGCTGGKHRSIVIAEELARNVSSESYLISVKHRDRGKE